MKEEIFRKESLEKFKSPDKLDEYICVSNPGVWILLLSIILLLSGACVWGIYGHIDSTVNADVRVENGAVVCFVSEDDISKITVGTAVRFDGFEGTISSVGGNTGHYYDCEVSVDEPVTDGSYDGKVVISSVKPMSLIFN